MQVNLENVSSVKKIFHVVVSEQEVTHEIDNAYKQINQTQKVKGFRKGKTPIAVLEKIFGDDIVASLESQLLSEIFPKILEGQDFAILGKPSVKTSGIKKGHPFNVDIILDVAPKLNPINIKGLNLTKKKYIIKDSEIEAHLKVLQQNIAKTEPILLVRPVQQGDFVVINLKGTFEGNIVDQSDNLLSKVGSLSLPKEIDAALIGMNTGDVKQVFITLPNNIENKQMAGKVIDFRVELKEIRKEVLPEINDDFAKELGTYNTLQDLKDSIRKNLESVYEVHSKREMNEQVYQALLDQQKFEIPDTLIDMELESIKKEIEGTAAERNLTMEKLGYTDDVIRQKYLKMAEKIAQREIILNHVITQENVTISPDELEETYKVLSEVKKDSLDSIKKYYSNNPDNFKSFEYTLKEQKALQMILDSSIISVTECGTEEAERDMNPLRGTLGL